MTSFHYTLNGSNAYKNKIFAGFSQLQKQDEFVDLTLAADGYIIKVHRNIIALASPYLREILKSMPSHSPVVFLNNVTHKILSYLLEYIYQGEVNVPADSINEFIEVSKSLHIAGISDIVLPQKPPPILARNRSKTPEKSANEVPTHITMDHSNIKEIQPCPTLITMDNSNLMEVQPYPTLNDHSQNNDGLIFDMDYSENQHKSTYQINDTNFMVQGIHNTHNMEQTHEYNTDISQNIPLIEIKSDMQVNLNTNKDQSYGHSLLSQTIAHQENQINVNPIPNTPVIAIDPDDTTGGHSQTNIAQFNYEIIVKPQSETNETAKTEGLPNIPAIVIQNLDLQEQQDQHIIMTSQNHSILPTQDQIPQAFQNDLSESIDQSNQIQIKILDDKILKPVLSSSEIIVTPLEGDVTTDALPLDGKISLNDLKNMAQFSVTERGAMQLILNRFMYCCHHSSRQKQRWRCIDYRQRACPALVDTSKGAIVTRKGLHSHEFHDKKIYKKHKQDKIFQTLELAKAARDSAQKKGLKTVPIDEIDT